MEHKRRSTLAPWRSEFCLFQTSTLWSHSSCSIKAPAKVQLKSAPLTAVLQDTSDADLTCSVDDEILKHAQSAEQVCVRLVSFERSFILGVSGHPGPTKARTHVFGNFWSLFKQVSLMERHTVISLCPEAVIGKVKGT